MSSFIDPKKTWTDVSVKSTSTFLNPEGNEDQTFQHYRLEDASSGFLAKTRLFKKQRKNWKGRKMPADMREKKNIEKERVESSATPLVPKLKLKKGNDLIELKETVNGVEIPQTNQPVAEYLFFWCPFCSVKYNDSINHGLTCLGKKEEVCTSWCEFCCLFVNLATHRCDEWDTRKIIDENKIPFEMDITDWELMDLEGGYVEECKCICGVPINPNKEYCGRCAKIGKIGVLHTHGRKGKLIVDNVCLCGGVLRENHWKEHNSPYCFYCTLKEAEKREKIGQEPYFVYNF